MISPSGSEDGRGRLIVPPRAGGRTTSPNSRFPFVAVVVAGGVQAHIGRRVLGVPTLLVCLAVQRVRLGQRQSTGRGRSSSARLLVRQAGPSNDMGSTDCVCSPAGRLGPPTSALLANRPLLSCELPVNGVIALRLEPAVDLREVLAAKEARAVSQCPASPSRRRMGGL